MGDRKKQNRPATWVARGLHRCVGRHALRQWWVMLAAVNAAIIAGVVAGGKADPEAPSCPHSTFSRSNRHGEHQHCICPAGNICVGCTKGCTEDSNMFKRRCITGFKPDCGDQCKCGSLQKGAFSLSLLWKKMCFAKQYTAGWWQRVWPTGSDQQPYPKHVTDADTKACL
jgi:hypothetical protein